MTAAQIIREARLKAGLTQTELAERLGRERAQVARACGFSLRIEIAEREDTPAVDAELEASLPQAPQQRVQALLDRLAGTG